MSKSKCPWRKVKTLSNKYDKWVCSSCQVTAKTPKGDIEPSKCQNAILEMFRRDKNMKRIRHE